MAYNEDSSASGHDEPWIQWYDFLITCIAVIAAEVKVLLTLLSTSSAASDPQVLWAEGSRDVL